jgi:hypothetical protein
VPSPKRIDVVSERSYLVAWLEGGHRHTPLPCLIIERSATTARIDAPDIAVPNEFTLLLTSDGSIRRECKVVSRRGWVIDVEFLSTV